MNHSIASKLMVIFLLSLTAACGHPQAPDSNTKVRQGQHTAVKSTYSANQLNHDKTQAGSLPTITASTDPRDNNADHSSIRSQPATLVTTADKQTATPEPEPVKIDNQANQTNSVDKGVCGGDGFNGDPKACSGFTYDGSPLKNCVCSDSTFVAALCKEMPSEELRKYQQFAKRCEEHQAQVIRCMCGPVGCSKDVRLGDTK